MSFWSDLGSSAISVVRSIPGIQSAPVIGGALDAASNLFAKKEAREAEDRAYNRQLDMMKYQNDWNEAMWQKTNEYNSPANQLKLLEDAGLNPNLLGGSGANPTASMASSASGSAPYDSGAGDRAQQRQSSLLNTLQMDAQISKLRNEIKYQDLINEDTNMLLESHREGRELPYSDDWFEDLMLSENTSDDGNLNYSVEVRNNPNRKKYNYYQEQREASREQMRRNVIGSGREAKELETYIYQQPWLRQMPDKQLQHLIEDIRAAKFNNDLLENDVEMLKKYGISPRDSNAFTALLRAAVRDPENVSRILQNLLKGVLYTGDDMLLKPVKRYIRRFSGSWQNNSHYNR